MRNSRHVRAAILLLFATTSLLIAACARTGSPASNQLTEDALSCLNPPGAPADGKSSFERLAESAERTHAQLEAALRRHPTADPDVRAKVMRLARLADERARRWRALAQLSDAATDTNARTRLLGEAKTFLYEEMNVAAELRGETMPHPEIR